MNSEKGPRERKQKHQLRKVFDEVGCEYSQLQGPLPGKLINVNRNLEDQRQKSSENYIQHNKQDKVDRLFKQAKTKKETITGKQVHQETSFTPKAVYLVEPSFVERRKLNIKSKLMNQYEPNFNRIEEQEINERAETYASTTPPDSNFFILPENVDEQMTSQNTHGKGKNSNIRTCSGLKERPKRKRRSYNNIECFVTHTRKDDVFGTKHYLPAGTKLIKPPKKLVELVADAVDKSPDGMLQVQQIYAVLQNKFPYFRYMDKLAISSWRSSIRHALYQKWFRKIRFCSEAISSKGCFWAINRSLKPEEWIVPYDPSVDTREADIGSTWKKGTPRHSTPFLDILQEPAVEDEHLKDVIQIAKEYGISFPDCVAEAKGEYQHPEKLNIPSPVKDPDPVLVACVPDYSIQTPKARKRQFEVDEGFEELPFKVTPMKVSPGVNSTPDTVSTNDDSLLTWTTLSFDELPTLFSPTYSMHPYGMPVFPEQNSQGCF